MATCGIVALLFVLIRRGGDDGQLAVHATGLGERLEVDVLILANGRVVIQIEEPQHLRSLLA